MPMVQGTVNSSGGGTGAAKVIYDAMWAGIQPTIPAGTAPDALAAAQANIANLANGVASLVGYIQANADTTTLVSPADAGLQAYTPTGAPAPIPTTPNVVLPPSGLPLALTGRVL